MMKTLIAAAGLTLMATPVLADPDKNESGKYYEPDRWSDYDRDGDGWRDRRDGDDWRDEDDRWDDHDRDWERDDRRSRHSIPAGHLPPPGSCPVHRAISHPLPAAGRRDELPIITEDG
jgi:hypothetical protein